MTYYTADCRCGNQAIFDVSETLDGMTGNYCAQCGQDRDWISVRPSTKKELEERGLSMFGFRIRILRVGLKIIKINY